MEKFTINSQDDTIANIITCLQYSAAGMGVARRWNYCLLSEYTIEFTLKEGEEIILKDIFWFGYYTAID